MRLVGQADFFEHDRDLDAVRGRQGIELQPAGMLGRPLMGDGVRGKFIHSGPWGWLAVALSFNRAARTSNETVRRRGSRDPAAVSRVIKVKGRLCTQRYRFGCCVYGLCR